jgi:hypothetical protein
LHQGDISSEPLFIIDDALYSLSFSHHEVGHRQKLYIFFMGLFDNRSSKWMF